jgi:putative heme-binding domain-containing protein
MRGRLWFIPGALLLIAAVFSVRAQHVDEGSEAPPTPVLNDRDEGKRLYAVHCATCHGPSGEGSRGPTLAQPNLSRAPDENSLVRIIASGISGTEMPRSRMDRRETSLVASYVRSLGTRPTEKVPGDPSRGQQLYFEKGQCQKCHTLNGQGSVFGGDLTDIGRMRSAAYLRRSLIEPNADVPQSFSRHGENGFPANFLYVRVLTRDGGDISGVRVNEDTFTIQVREAPGKVHSFFKDQVTLQKAWGKSPMPSYADAFTADEMDDLVAFLVSLRGQR